MKKSGNSKKFFFNDKIKSLKSINKLKIVNKNI